MSELSGEFDELQRSYGAKWDQTKLTRRIALDVDHDAMAENAHLQRHADTEDAIRQVHGVLMDHLNEAAPAIEIIRDDNGRASAIKKGERILTIERGANGRATGLR